MSWGSTALVLLCLANAIPGSLQFQDWDYFGRQLRHAACPSCRRERPDALVSWDSQPRREYEFEAESGPWPFRSSPYGNPYGSRYNAYERAVRSRGAAGRAGGAGRRENPFTIGRGLDFDVAPAQAPVVRGLAGLLTAPYQAGLPYPRTSRRPQYRKPSFYDDEARTPTPANRFADFLDNEFVSAITRGDRYLADSFEEGNPMMEPEQSLRRAFPYGTGATGVRTQEAGQFPWRRDQPEVIYRPEVRRRAYNRSPDSNASRTTQQSVARQAPEIVNNNRWQNQFEDGKKEPEIVSKREENRETEMGEEINVSESDDGAEDVKEKRDVKGDDGSGETTGVTTERPLVIMTIPPLVMP